MIGLILATHSSVSKEIVKAMSMIVGEIPNCRTWCLNPGDSIDELQKEMTQNVVELDEGEGVLIMTDLLGGTPANMALTVSIGRNVKVLTGLNLPMVMQFFDDRNSGSLNEVTEICRDAGSKGIVNISEILLRRA